MTLLGVRVGYGVLVAKNDTVFPDPDREGRYAFVCPECEFVSSGWSTKKGAVARGDQHLEEHESGKAAPELADSGIPGAVQE